MFKISLTNIVEKVVVSLIVAAITAAITWLFKTYVIISDWLNNLELKINLIIFLVIGVVLLAAAILWLFKFTQNRMIDKIFPLIIFFIGTALITNSLPIIFQKQTVLIERQEISLESLLKQNTIDIQINSQYKNLTLEIIRTGTSKFNFPEIELEKVSPLRGDWVSLVEEFTADKLIIQGLETANTNEHFYFLINGSFRVQEADGTDIILNEENKIRVNVRNFAEFGDTITLLFYGTRKQGEGK